MLTVQIIPAENGHIVSATDGELTSNYVAIDMKQVRKVISDLLRAYSGEIQEPSG